MKHLIFSNYNLEDKVESEIQFYKDEFDEDITEEEALANIYGANHVDWHMTKEMLESAFRGKHSALIGTLNGWNYSSYGMDIFEDVVHGIESFLEDCDFWSLEEDDGHLFLQGTHHDGTNHCEIYVIDESGVAFAENYEGNSSHELITQLHLNGHLSAPYFTSFSIALS